MASGSERQRADDDLTSVGGPAGADRRPCHKRIINFLTGHGEGGGPGPYYRIVQGAAAAWQAPPLAEQYLP